MPPSALAAIAQQTTKQLQSRYAALDSWLDQTPPRDPAYSAAILEHGAIAAELTRRQALPAAPPQPPAGTAAPDPAEAAARPSALASPQSQTDIWTAQPRAPGATPGVQPAGLGYPNLSSAIHAMLAKHGIPAAERYLQKRFLGVYKRRGQNVRAQFLADIFTPVHEAVHFFSDTAKIGQKILADTAPAAGRRGWQHPLRKALTEAYVALYPNAKASDRPLVRIEEGMAALFQYYAWQPTAIRQQYGPLLDMFLQPGGRYYDPRFQVLIDDIGRLIASFQQLSPAEQIGARMASGREAPRLDPGFTLPQRLVFELFDMAEPLRRWARYLGVSEQTEDPTVWFYQWLHRSTLINTWIRGSHTLRITPAGKFIVEPGSVAEYAKLIAGREEDFNRYLIARRVVADHARLGQLRQQLRNMLQGLDLNNLDPAQAREIARIVREIKSLRETLANDNIPLAVAQAAASQLGPDFLKPAAIFDKLNRRLVLLARDLGLISSEEATKYLQREHYAAFLRQINDELLDRETMFLFLPRHGSELDIVWPTTGQALAIYHIVTRGLSNAIWERVVALGDTHPEIARRLEIIPAVVVPDPEGRPHFPQTQDKNLIRVWRRGKVAFVKPAPEFRALIDAMTPADLGSFASLLTIPSAVFTRLTTSANPLFAMANLTVDQITAVINTRTGLRPGVDPVLQMKEMLQQWSDPASDLNRYLMAGGRLMHLAGSLREKTPEQFLRALSQERSIAGRAVAIVDSGLSLLELPSNMSEYVTRMVEFQRSLKRGESDIVAMYRAAEVTTPFMLGGRFFGPAGQFWLRSIPYLKATMAALYKHGRAIEADPRRAAAVYAAVVAAGMLSDALMLALASDEQWRILRNVEAGELARYLFVPLPDGKRLWRVRIPETIGAILGPVTLLMIAAHDREPVKAGELWEAMTAWVPPQFNITQPTAMTVAVLPKTIQPSVQTALNRRIYPNTAPIVPEYLAERPAPEQYNRYTSRVAMGLGRALGLSPQKIEFWVRNQFGAVGGFLLGKTQSMPIVAEAELIGRSYNHFYRTFDELKSAYSRMREGSELRPWPESEQLAQRYRLYSQLNAVLFQLRQLPSLPEEIKQAVQDVLLTLQKGADPDELHRVSSAVGQLADYAKTAAQQARSSSQATASASPAAVP